MDCSELPPAATGGHQHTAVHYAEAPDKQHREPHEQCFGSSNIFVEHCFFLKISDFFGLKNMKLAKTSRNYRRVWII